MSVVRIKKNLFDFLELLIEPYLLLNQNLDIISFNSDFSYQFGLSRKEVLNKKNNATKICPELIQKICPLITHDILSTSHYEQMPLNAYNHHTKAAIHFNLFTRKVLVEEEVYILILLAKKPQDTKYLKHLIEHDSLTKIPSRAYFNKEIKKSFEHSKKTGGRFALLLIDIDKCKYANDNYGHQFGDELLTAVTKRIDRKKREKDFFARLSGDEFVILSKNCQNFSQASQLAARLLHAFLEPIKINGFKIKISISIGIAICFSAKVTKFELLEQADNAMYKAKRKGGNRFEF